MWQVIVVCIAGFWLSSSLILDSVLMPMFYVSGMMNTSDFATMGYELFWVFNRLELMCAALILTGVLVVHYTQRWAKPMNLRSLGLPALLLLIAIVDTYGLTPQMGGLGLHLNLFATETSAPALMNGLHASYWLLEIGKFVAGGVLLQRFYRSPVAA